MASAAIAALYAWGALWSAVAAGSGGAAAVVVEHPRPEMQLIPAGAFSMGFPDTPEEREHLTRACVDQLGGEFAELCGEERYASARGPREVLLFAYAIDRREVTVTEYRRCVEAGACDVAPLLAGDSRYVRGAWPMVNVTWHDAAAYCAWRGARLPTEAEWEKAARGTDERRYPWGDRLREGAVNHGRVEDPAMTKTHGLVGGAFGRPILQFVPEPAAGSRYALPPGSLPWGASPYGLYDMAGNVSEWVADYYDPGGYGDLPATDPVRIAPSPGNSARVVRGGSWMTPRFYGRTYYRDQAEPNARSRDRGFRCARDAGPDTRSHRTGRDGQAD